VFATLLSHVCNPGDYRDMLCLLLPAGCCSMSVLKQWSLSPESPFEDDCAHTTYNGDAVCNSSRRGHIFRICNTV
jgi:hypothetical protein